MMIVKDQDSGEVAAFEVPDLVRLTLPCGGTLCGEVVDAGSSSVMLDDDDILETEEDYLRFLVAPLLAADTTRFSFTIARLTDGSLDVLERLPVVVRVDVTEARAPYRGDMGTSAGMSLSAVIRRAGKTGDEHLLYLFVLE